MLSAVTPTLVAIGHPSRASAEDALAAVQAAARERRVALKDAAIVTIGPDGRPEIVETKDVAVGEGLVAGGTVGLVLGLLIGLPVAVALAGLAGGGGLAAFDRGLPSPRLRRIARELEPGRAALCVLVDEASMPELHAVAERYEGAIVVAEPLASDAASTTDSTEP
jgi:uncharacterized membrane protein